MNISPNKSVRKHPLVSKNIHQLSGADLANFELDQGDNYYVVTVSGLLSPGGFIHNNGDIDLPQLCEYLSPRIQKFPRLAMRILPNGTLEPNSLDLNEHLRIEKPVKTETAFINLGASLSTSRLNPELPLWELLLVPITDEAAGTVGWIFRVHHALFDGTMVARIFLQLFDQTDSQQIPPAFSTANLTTRALYRLQQPIAGIKSGTNMLRHILSPVPASQLLGPLGDQRIASVDSYPLDPLLRLARSQHAKLNDLILVAAAQGINAAYENFNAVPPKFFPISVPVLLPGAITRTNQVAAAVIPVPLSNQNLRQQIRSLAPVARKRINQARHAPLPWFSASMMGGRIMRKYISSQRMIGMLTTNVKGPTSPISLCGAPVVRVWGLPVIAGNVRTAIAATSYNGSLDVGPYYSANLGEGGKAFARGVHQALQAMTEMVPKQ